MHRTDRRGFTLIEIMIAIGLVGLLAAIGIPRIGEALRKQDVISARAAVISKHSQARAVAIQSASRTFLVFDGNTLRIYSRHPVTGAMRQVGPDEDLNVRYGVTVRTTNDTVGFDPRGLGNGTADTQVTVTKGPHTRSVVINALGRVLQ